MKKNKKIILFTILSLLFSTNVYASCTEEEINDFKKIEDEYKITYEFNKETKDYTVIFIRKEPDRFDYYIDSTGIKCDDINENKAQCFNFKPQKYDIYIIGQTEECDDILKTITLNLPYNSLSEDPICEGIEEFVLCQPTYSKEIDYDTFVSRVNTYKKSKVTQSSSNNNNSNKENELITYIKENLLTIITISIFIILVIITIILTARSIKKSRRLE